MTDLLLYIVQWSIKHVYLSLGHSTTVFLKALKLFHWLTVCRSLGHSGFSHHSYPPGIKQHGVCKISFICSKSHAVKFISLLQYSYGDWNGQSIQYVCEAPCHKQGHPGSLGRACKWLMLVSSESSCQGTCISSKHCKLNSSKVTGKL